MATIHDPNKKIDVKREEVADRDSWAEPAMLLQQTAASMHPDGCTYKGSLAVHIYEVNGRMDMVLKSQIHVDGDVPSPQAWFAVKELIHAARKHYGHQEKKASKAKISPTSKDRGRWGTTIRIGWDIYDHIIAQGKFGESFNEVLRRLLNSQSA